MFPMKLICNWLVWSTDGIALCLSIIIALMQKFAVSHFLLFLFNFLNLNIIFQKKKKKAAIGGLTLALTAKRDGICVFIPAINDNFPRPQYCVVTPRGERLAGVRIRVKIGECAPQTLVTEQDGCVDLTFDSNNCYSRSTNQLLIEGNVIVQESVAKSECQSVLYSCRSLSTRLGVICDQPKEIGTHCEYDAQKKACSRSTCASGRKCEEYRMLNGAPACR